MERKFAGPLVAAGLCVISLNQPTQVEFEQPLFDFPRTPIASAELEAEPESEEAPILEEILVKEVSPLEAYLDSIWDQEVDVKDIIETRGNILSGIKNISEERMLQEFERYFPMYKAGEIEYGVPWSLLMIIHAHETTFSSDPLTYNNLHNGAMHRAKGSWPEAQIYSASEGWEFLAGLPQRYPNDFREILWAAKHIKDQAELRYDYLPKEAAILAVVRNNYSAPSNAVLRINKYAELKSLQITT